MTELIPPKRTCNLTEEPMKVVTMTSESTVMLGGYSLHVLYACQIKECRRVKVVHVMGTAVRE